MPSNVNPTTIATGPGKIPVDTVSAAAELSSSGSSALLTTLTDVLTQPVAKVTTLAFIAGGSGDTTRVLPSGAAGPYYVGSADLTELFKVVNIDDTEIFNPVTGLYVSVASVNVPLSGYVTTVTLTFNTPVPANLSYKVYYGRQFTLASLPADFVTSPMIKRSAERARFPELPRTGLAPTSTTTSAAYNAAYPDPILAQWKATLKGNNVAAYDDARGGAVGFAHVGSIPHVLDTTGNDVFKDNLAGAAFLAVYEKDIRATSFTTTPTSTPYTKVNSTLNVSVTATSVTLNAADYIRSGTNTSFRLGVDMLEITYTDGSKMTVIPTTFNSGNVRILDNCKTLGGDTANMPVSATAKARWIRPSFFVGGGHGKFSNGVLFTGMQVLSPGCITDQPAQEVEHEPPFFSAGTLLPTRAGVNSWNIKAFTWGAYTETGASVGVIGKRSVKGELRGDGSLLSLGGHVEGLITQRAGDPLVLSIGNTNYSFNPFNGSFLSIVFVTGAILTMTLDAAYIADQKDGDQITLLIVSYQDATTNRVVWPTQFVFSGSDATLSKVSAAERYLPGTVPNTGVVNYYKFSGISFQGSFYMTRTDYEV